MATGELWLNGAEAQLVRKASLLAWEWDGLARCTKRGGFGSDVDLKKFFSSTSVAARLLCRTLHQGAARGTELRRAQEKTEGRKKSQFRLVLSLIQLH